MRLEGVSLDRAIHLTQVVDAAVVCAVVLAFTKFGSQSQQGGDNGPTIMISTSVNPPRRDVLIFITDLSLCAA